MSNWSVSADEEGSRMNEDYSEWGLVHGGLGFAFDIVVVNEAFHIRDFQSSQGAVSVIDPETLGRLRKEASVILNNRIRCQLVVVLVLLPGCTIMFFYLLGVGFVRDDDASVVLGMFANWGLVFFLSYVAYICLRNNADTKLNALVDSYQQIFNEYGVELGYPRNNLLFGIYLRRPHQSVDDETASVIGDSEDMDGRYPPIYLAALIPGEIHIGEKDYDTSSMKLDAGTWTLLQSTHESLIRWNFKYPKMQLILFLLGWWSVSAWLGTFQHGFVTVWVFLYILLRVLKYAMDIRNLKVFCEVTNVVNEALRKDKDSRLRVEFHASEVPGREGKLGYRYQFVKCDLTPINELI